LELPKTLLAKAPKESIDLASYRKSLFSGDLA